MDKLKMAALAFCGALALAACSQKSESGSAKEADESTADEQMEPIEVCYFPHQVDVQPEYPGGEEALEEYLTNASIDVLALDTEAAQLNDYISVQFTVDSKGNIIDVTAEPTEIEGLAEQAVEAVKSMPHWAPGQIDGEPVPVICSIDIPVVNISSSSVTNTVIDIVEDDKVIYQEERWEDYYGDYRDIDDGVDDATKTVVKENVVIVEDKPRYEDEVYFIKSVEEEPVFPNGEKAMYEWMNRNLTYPVAAQEDGIEGTVVVLFIINTDGSVTNARAVRSPSEILSEEALRLVNSMPKWTPGRNYGKPVKVEYTLPVRFKLSN